jgi:hypothetical protein
MNVRASHSPLQFLIAAAVTQVMRRRYLSISVAVHAALLALLFYFGSYQLELREQEAEVASSLRATSLASTAERLEDLQTIKQLLEKSADRVAPPEAGLDPLVPQTPEEIVRRARELSEEIDALDEQIKAEELAKLTGAPEPPPLEAGATDEPPAAGNPDEVSSTDAHETDAEGQAAITAEMAASEVAALEAKARVTLIERQRRLEAKEGGVQIGRLEPGAGEQASQGKPSAGSVMGRGAPSSARGDIADFIGGAGGRPDEMKRSQTYASLSFFNDGSLRIPPVDASTLVRGHGRMLGAGGEYASRVYLNTWYIIGPFPGRHGTGLFDNPPYPPEKAVLLDAMYYGKDQRVLKWRYVTAHHYPLVPPDSAEDSVYYGYTEVSVDEACDLVAWIGADDDVQVYLNDRLVWEGGNVNKRPYFDAIFATRNTYLRDYNRTEGQRVLHFEKGRNKIFFKLSNGPNHPFLSMVLTR